MPKVLIVSAMAAFCSTVSFRHSLLHCSVLDNMFISALFFTLSLITLSALLFYSYSKKRSCKRRFQEERIVAARYAFLPETFTDANDAAENGEDQVGQPDDPARLRESLLLEVVQPGEMGTMSVKDGGHEAGSGLEQDGEDRKRKAKKRMKKKRIHPHGGEEEERKEELVLLYPFTTSSGGIRRKIKERFDQLAKSHESNCLTMTQVGQFANFLLEAKKELQHRSEVIQRKFRITKALLMKADRSSFDRLRQQIYRVELEQKRLEEDAFVHNRVQQLLTVSPAYKKMLKISDCPDMKTKTAKAVDGSENDFTDISFEELLAQEKKDGFWQRRRKPEG